MAVAVLGIALAVTGCQSGTPTAPANPPASGSPTSPDPTAVPGVTLKVLADQLAAPSSLSLTHDGTILVTTATGIQRFATDGTLTTLTHDLTDVASDAAGLLDIALAPEFPRDAQFYLCYRTRTDIRIVPMSTSRDLKKAEAGPAILTGLPLPVGKTGGCRIAFGPDGYLYVGTTDGGDPKGPQDLSSLGGKILRLDVQSRQPAPGNPFIDRPDLNARLIYSFGHREITGLAWHPTSGALYAIDRGPGREDEVNVIVAGGNYGWDPASKSATSYQVDGVAMTDLSIAQARPAAWNSGTSSPGLGPATFVTGAQWGMLAGSLAVSNTAGPRILFLPVTGEIVGHPVTLSSPNPIGPTAAIAQDDDGSLLLLTAVGSGDRLVRATVIS